MARGQRGRCGWRSPAARAVLGGGRSHAPGTAGHSPAARCREVTRATGGSCSGGLACHAPPLAPMGSPAAPPARGEAAGPVSRAGGHTEDGTVRCGHILFSGCTCALFLLNSQSFTDSKPSPFSPTPARFSYHVPPFPTPQPLFRFHLELSVCLESVCSEAAD